MSSSPELPTPISSCTPCSSSAYSPRHSVTWATRVACSLWQSWRRPCTMSTLRTKITSRVPAVTRAAAQCVGCSGVSSRSLRDCAKDASLKRPERSSFAEDNSSSRPCKVSPTALKYLWRDARARDAARRCIRSCFAISSLKFDRAAPAREYASAVAFQKANRAANEMIAACMGSPSGLAARELLESDCSCDGRTASTVGGIPTSESAAAASPLNQDLS
mmetsp:Transcript_60972/g.145215  ORF Transcript_60972/g.145215 Transcript_60972/m.145215 type:complete len:219 (-) Transcript_60972:358-1014(-)